MSGCIDNVEYSGSYSYVYSYNLEEVKEGREDIKVVTPPAPSPSIIKKDQQQEQEQEQKGAYEEQEGSFSDIEWYGLTILLVIVSVLVLFGCYVLLWSHDDNSEDAVMGSRGKVTTAVTGCNGKAFVHN